MRVLGIEGTAWAASAAVFDTDRNTLSIETDPYVPESGGIHPREAAEHMTEAVPRVIETVLERDGGAGGEAKNENVGAIDAVAFSRGPGLGPCLRVVATAARAFSLSRDVALVGVNHMIAHAEIGRYGSGFRAPICLNASGANAHVLGYRNGKYRILGETMDTGVGNAIDKFARHLGWSHPGGPKIEAAAEGGTYLSLPYVVKGMDFSFSGLMSAAKAAIDEGKSTRDVCFSLQETTFAMLTEVTERALSLTGADELVLGGGVGRNARLQAMLSEMCAARDARFFVPEPRLLGDNAGMIAVLGARMAKAGDTISVPDSRVRSDFRPDEVVVTWPLAEPGCARERAGSAAVTDTDAEAGTDRSEAPIRGAEAVVEIDGDRVEKRRPEKTYRYPALDDRLRRERIVSEARLTSAARRLGVPTPVINALDTQDGSITFERVGETDLSELVAESTTRIDAARRAPAGPDEPDQSTAMAAVAAVGRHLATLHSNGLVHGDPTTRNVRVSSTTRSDSASHTPGRTYLIDFGLGYHSDSIEDYAMDLHVFAGSLAGTAPDAERLREHFTAAYETLGSRDVTDRLCEIEGRGRYR